MNGILAITISALTLSAPAFADTVPEGAIIFAYQPVGNGDPKAVTCWAWRTTPPVRGLKCARNSQWARMNRNLASGPDGSPPSPNSDMFPPNPHR